MVEESRDKAVRLHTQNEVAKRHFGVSGLQPSAGYNKYDQNCFKETMSGGSCLLPRNRRKAAVRFLGCSQAPPEVGFAYRHTQSFERCSLSLVELLKLLLLEGSGLGELKVDLVGGQLLVGMSDGVEFVLNQSLV